MSSSSPPASATSAIASLHPASFSIAMATGIVSVAAELRGFHAVALALLWLNIVFYLALWLLTLIRLARYRKQVVADLWDHNRSVGYFAIIAATCMLGSQFIIVHSLPHIAI